jgi:hypothetical protein
MYREGNVLSADFAEERRWRLENEGSSVAFKDFHPFSNALISNASVQHFFNLRPICEICGQNFLSLNPREKKILIF